MREQTITVGESPRIEFESVAGNLNLNSWENAQIQVRSDSDGLHVEGGSEQVLLQTDGNCNVFAPIHSDLRLEKVYGNAWIGEFTGRLELESVHGNLHVQRAGETVIETVRGNFTADHIEGSLRVERVAGNLKVNEVTGDVEGRADGNIVLTSVSGSVRVGAKGDVSACFEPGAEGESELSAHGNVNCYLTPEANVHIVVRKAHDILIRGLPAPVERARGACEFTLGSGGAEIAIEAHGNVVISGDGVRGQPFGTFAGFSVEIDEETRRQLADQASNAVQQVTDQIAAQMDVLAHQLEARLAEFGSSEEIAARIHEKVTRALQKAEEKITRALSEADRRARQAEERAARVEERQQRRGGMRAAPMPPPPAPPPPPPRPKRAPVSDEERMQVLRMVENGKISIEQAEQLLKALNG